MMLHRLEYDSPVGKLLLASDGISLHGIWIAGQPYIPAKLAAAHEKPDAPLSAAIAWLDAYFMHQPLPEIPQLYFSDSDFRLRVWKVLQQIPQGKVVSYGQIAKHLVATTPGSRVAAQAVGGAVGHNPFSILIPCHRVVGADGRLTGYAGGLERKIELLAHEGISLTQLRSDKLSLKEYGGNFVTGNTRFD